MSEQISKRIANELGVPNVSALLSDKLSGADLHSLLLNIFKKRAARAEPNKLVSESRVTQACSLDGRLLNKIESTGFEAAHQFEVLELSPLGPLGAVACLTGLDQANVLSTIRSFECSSDPTIAMALECARRRKHPSTRAMTNRLCTSQRVVRFPVPDKPGFTAHFKLFSLVSSARDSGSFFFEVEALREHIGVYLSFLEKLNALQFSFKEIFVEISHTVAVAQLCSKFGIDRDEIRRSVRARDSKSSDKLLEQYSSKWSKTFTETNDLDLPAHLQTQLTLLEEHVCRPLNVEHPQAHFSFNLHRLTGLSYYDGPCFHIKITNEHGDSFMIADGGFVNWTQLLLSDAKERLMTSAIGIELMCRMFRTEAAQP